MNVEKWGSDQKWESEVESARHVVPSKLNESSGDLYNADLCISEGMRVVVCANGEVSRSYDVMSLEGHWGYAVTNYRLRNKLPTTNS